MAIRRKCEGRPCSNGRRCLEYLQFDTMHRGVRYRMMVNEFAIPCMEPGRRRPVASMEEARDWERLFVGEIKAGRDPRSTPEPPAQAEADLQHVAGFLDAYFDRQVRPAALRSIPSIKSRIGVLKEYFGELPVKSLERPDEINRFKTDSDYADEVEVATLHKVLATLRAAIHSGMAQTPPLLDKSPFHRFGVRLNKKQETSRDRRISRAEEKRLLDTALAMNTWKYRYVGPLLHDRIIGALELCCRRGEMLLIQNRRVDWESHQIGIPGHTTKDRENRRIPFDPQGRLAPILKRRATLGPSAFVFGSPAGEYVDSFKTAWESLLLLANGHDTTRVKPGARVDRAKLRQIDLHWHDLRHEGALPAARRRVDVRSIQLLLGHADMRQTQRYLNITDEELRKAMTGVWERRRQLRAIGH